MKPGSSDAILIWGAGAIGGILGAYWARAGHEVVLVDINEEHVHACNEHGLQIEGPVENFTQPVNACTPERVEGSWDRIVLAVKAQHTSAALPTLLPHLADNGYILSAQNGLNEHLIADAAGKDRIIGAFVNYGADWMAPGRIMFGNRGAVVVGEIDGAIRTRTRKLHAMLSDFEPDALLTDDIWAYLWGKMGYGAMLFATALTHENMSENFASSERAPVLIALAREVMLVAAAEGVKPVGFNGYDPAAFHADASAAQAQACINDLIQFTAQTTKTHTGIYRDIVVRKRKTEVDPQIVSIVEVGERHQIPVPLNRRLVELIHDIEEGRREQSAATFNELKAVVS